MSIFFENLFLIQQLLSIWTSIILYKVLKDNHWYAVIFLYIVSPRS